VETIRQRPGTSGSFHHQRVLIDVPYGGLSWSASAAPGSGCRARRSAAQLARRTRQQSLGRRHRSGHHRGFCCQRKRPTTGLLPPQLLGAAQRVERTIGLQLLGARPPTNFAQLAALTKGEGALNRQAVAVSQLERWAMWGCRSQRASGPRWDRAGASRRRASSQEFFGHAAGSDAAPRGACSRSQQLKGPGRLNCPAGSTAATPSHPRALPCKRAVEEGERQQPPAAGAMRQTDLRHRHQPAEQMVLKRWASSKRRANRFRLQGCWRCHRRPGRGQVAPFPEETKAIGQSPGGVQTGPVDRGQPPGQATASGSAKAQHAFPPPAAGPPRRQRPEAR